MNLQNSYSLAENEGVMTITDYCTNFEAVGRVVTHKRRPKNKKCWFGIIKKPTKNEQLLYLTNFLSLHSSDNSFKAPRFYCKKKWWYFWLIWCSYISLVDLLDWCFYTTFQLSYADPKRILIISCSFFPKQVIKGFPAVINVILYPWDAQLQAIRWSIQCSDKDNGINQTVGSTEIH